MSNPQDFLRPADAPAEEEHHIFYLVRRLRNAAFDCGEADAKGQYIRGQYCEKAMYAAEEALRREIKMHFRDALSRT
jgi:hypothetical protein